MCMRVSVRACACVHACVCLCVLVHARLCMCLCMSVCVYACTRARACRSISTPAGPESSGGSPQPWGWAAGHASNAAPLVPGSRSDGCRPPCTSYRKQLEGDRKGLGSLGPPGNIPNAPLLMTPLTALHTSQTFLAEGEGGGVMEGGQAQERCKWIVGSILEKQPLQCGLNMNSCPTVMGECIFLSSSETSGTNST